MPAAAGTVAFNQPPLPVFVGNTVGRHAACVGVLAAHAGTLAKRSRAPYAPPTAPVKPATFNPTRNGVGAPVGVNATAKREPPSVSTSCETALHV